MNSSAPSVPLERREMPGADPELRSLAAAIYKLGLLAAELGLTGQEPAEELVAAVRALKARAHSARNLSSENPTKTDHP